MKAKLCSMLSAVIILFSVTSAANAERVYCPPVSAVHCDGQGQCTLDPAYDAYWGAIDVDGTPQPDLMFGGVEINGSIECMYGTSMNNAVSLYAKRPFAPDTSTTNHWENPFGFWMCDAISGGQVEDCPMILS